MHFACCPWPLARILTLHLPHACRWSNTGTAYYESEKAHDHAKTYSTQYSQFFHVGNFSKTSIFPNRVEINKN